MCNFPHSSNPTFSQDVHVSIFCYLLHVLNMHTYPGNINFDQKIKSVLFLFTTLYCAVPPPFPLQVLHMHIDTIICISIWRALHTVYHIYSCTAVCIQCIILCKSQSSLYMYQQLLMYVACTSLIKSGM